MKTPMAEEAESGFGWLIDRAGAEPAAIAKHGRAAVVMAVKKFERLKLLETGGPPCETTNRNRVTDDAPITT